MFARPATLKAVRALRLAACVGLGVAVTAGGVCAQTVPPLRSPPPQSLTAPTAAPLEAPSPPPLQAPAAPAEAPPSAAAPLAPQPGAPAPPPQQELSAPDAWVAKTTATLRVMNKIDSTVQTITLKTGETTHLQTLTLQLSGCFARPDDLPADSTAHLTIHEDGNPAPILDGWILAKEPALNMLQHPVYDLQLASCGS